MILKVVNYLVLGFINLYSLYFFITGLGYFKKKKMNKLKTKRKTILQFYYQQEMKKMLYQT